jgi:hypothetical protein
VATAAKSGGGFVGFLKAKKGPLPVYAWILGLAALYWFVIRPRLASSSATAAGVTPTSPAGPITTDTGGGTVDTGDTGGGSGDIGASNPAPITADSGLNTDLLNAFLQQGSQTEDALTTALATESQQGAGGYVNPPPSSTQLSGPASPVGQTSTHPAFGGVVKVQTLKNGATLTTYASGHQVEQAKGKTPYVVKK